MTETAPIALFVYNRIEHTKKTIETLSANRLAKQSVLYIFSDGAKNEESKLAVSQLREYINNIDGFKEINIIERNENFGLAKSIITGVTEVISSHGKIIVLEDDLLLSPHFLKYMNDALNIYENEEKVACIHGYVYPVKNKLPETFFIRGADCWGWATWRRGWEIFEPDGKKLLQELKEKKLRKRFDLNYSYNFTKMLEDQVSGKNNSWAIRWHASVFLKNKFTLYPGKSLVHNTGLDNSGTHCDETNIYDINISLKEIEIENIPLEESTIALKEFELFFKGPKSFLGVKSLRSKIIKSITRT